MAKCGRHLPSPGLVAATAACELLGCAHASTRGPGQRSERSVRTVPSCLNVAAIERDQRARGFKNRVRLIRQSLAASLRKPRCQPADRFELADQHGGCCGGGLTDLIERQFIRHET